MSCRLPPLGRVFVWHYLTDTSTWESYYDNVADISFPNGGGPELKEDIVFSFGTFGFPPLDAHVVELQAPADGVPGRLSWTAKQDGKPEEQLDVMHAWLVEDLPGGRVRILTQETHVGQPAAALAKQLPNPMLNGHQA
ncbi:SRPBCC domain-containing protein [Streptomyces sp. NPDC006356]